MSGTGASSGHRRRLLLLATFVAVLAVPSASLASALAGPGNDALTTRSVEWVRDHHGVWLVDHAERWWYLHHPPPVGGRPAAPLLHAAAPTTTTTTTTTDPPPMGEHAAAAEQQPTAPVVAPAAESGAAVPSPASPALPGEGVWVPVPSTGGALERTAIRPDAVHTSELVGILRIDQTRTRLALFPGLKEPGAALPEPSAVPRDEQPGLVAAFNGGFRMRDARGGFFEDGVAADPLVAGAASIALRADGTATLGTWGRDVTMSPDVVAVRQNLVLLVDGGAAAPDLTTSDPRRWGFTLGNEVLVWRSGIGQTADGSLVYVAGPALSAASLADVLVRAGAVRAMELDINADWTTCNLYHRTPSGQEVGEKLLPTMKRPGDRYLTPDSRDFFAAFLR